MDLVAVGKGFLPSRPFKTPHRVALVRQADKLHLPLPMGEEKKLSALDRVRRRYRHCRGPALADSRDCRYQAAQRQRFGHHYN